VERIVRREVRHLHGILGVRELRDLRRQRVDEVGLQHGELGLDEDPGKVDLRLSGLMDRRGGLAAVDDLQAVDARDRHSGANAGRFHALGRQRDAVVVGQKQPRLLLERIPDPLVHLPLRLEERAHIALE